MRAALAPAFILLARAALLAGTALADSRMQSSCIALTGAPQDVHLPAGAVRIRSRSHASFALETPGGGR